MKANIGSLDKNIRRLIVVALILAAYFGPAYVAQITKQVQTYLLVAAAIVFITTLINWCPLYAPFKINTTGKKAAKKTAKKAGKKSSKKRK